MKSKPRIEKGLIIERKLYTSKIEVPTIKKYEIAIIPIIPEKIEANKNQ